jgi:uncharacterized protein (UPF0332 family)
MSGGLTKEIGRLLKRAEEIRIVADYTGDSIELADAREIIEQAAIFVSTLQAEFLPDQSSGDSRRLEP